MIDPVEYEKFIELLDRRVWWLLAFGVAMMVGSLALTFFF